MFLARFKNIKYIPRLFQPNISRIHINQIKIIQKVLYILFYISNEITRLLVLQQYFFSLEQHFFGE